MNIADALELYADALDRVDVESLTDDERAAIADSIERVKILIEYACPGVREAALALAEPRH